MLLAQVAGMPHVWGTVRGWWAVVAFPALLGALQLMLMPLLVESPTWLSHVGRTDEAERVRLVLEGSAPGASRAHGSATNASHAGYAGILESESSASVIELQGTVAAEPSENSGASAQHHAQSSVRLLLTDSRLRALLILSVVSLVTQQFSGINVAFNYSTTYLQERGVPMGWVDAVNLMMNVANVGSTLLAAWLVDRVGRRVLLLSSTAGMAACVALITYGMARVPSEVGVRTAAVGIVAFVFCFGIGLGPVPWLVPGELFEQTHRATAQGVAALCNWASNGLVALAFLPMAQMLGAQSFLPFGAVLVLYVIYAAVALPETRDRRPDSTPAALSSAPRSELADAGDAGQENAGK